MYPTYDVLAACVSSVLVKFLDLTYDVSFFSAGITPSNKTTYSLAQITEALKAQTGTTPYVGCVQNGTALSEVWYFHHVKGSVSCLRHFD